MGEKPDKKWLQKYLAPLVGGKIIKVGVSKEGFPQITVVCKGDVTFTLEVGASEGNGPGFLFGLPIKGGC